MASIKGFFSGLSASYLSAGPRAERSRQPCASRDLGARRGNVAVSRDSLHLRCDVESSRGAQVPQPHHHPKRHLMRTHMRRREQPDHGGVG